MPLPATSRFAERLAQTSPIWIVVWAGLAVLTVALLVLMRTQWGQSRPMRKCAVLSLLAHVVLACFAMTIKIVASNSEGPARPAMHVALVDSGPAPSDESTRPRGDLDAKPWDPRPSGPVVAPVVAPLTPPDLSSLPIRPTIHAADENRPKTSADEVSDQPDAEPSVENRPTDALPAKQIQVATGSDNPPAPLEEITQQPLVNVLPDMPPTLSPEFTRSEDVSKTVEPSASQARPSPDAVFRYRTAAARQQIARRSGGSGKTEALVDKALTWLARSQSPDGRWSAARHGAGRERAVHRHDRRGAGLQADTGVTGLALLAFLGAGHTHRQGNYQETVAVGLKYLVNTQNGDGNLAGHASLYAKTYCHAMATYALAEALAMTGDPTFEAAGARAVGYSIRTQHRGSGGWRYQPGNPGDTSQLGWQVMALRSAERAGLVVPDATWRGIDRFLQSVAFGTGRGLASYRPKAAPSRTMTAEAAYCRQLVWNRSQIGGLGSRINIAAKRRADDEAIRYLLTELPGDGLDNLYYWYYATLFLHGRTDDAAAEGARQSDWIRWNDALKSKLIASQQAHGPLAGSWSPDTVWGGYGGRVYSTALAALCLEVYYRYAEEEDRVAKRPGHFESPR